MSLTNEYKKLDEERLAEGEKSRAHYNSLNLPGDRVKSTAKDAAQAARERIAEMKKERENAGQAEK
ncbi:hypothetical protein [Lewinella sp. LCG006]|uniref:hypothetical protein n=1 Tax=Lewinella sp. LCG006 TaxID=3231911 RepID=UPI00346068CA